MSRNLDHKIGLLLDDVEGMSRYEAIRRIVEFVNNELEFHKVDHYLDNYDLTAIHSNAVKHKIDLSVKTMTDMGTDNSRQIAWCYVDSIVGELRRLGLIGFKLQYTPKKKMNGGS